MGSEKPGILNTALYLVRLVLHCVHAYFFLFGFPCSLSINVKNQTVIVFFIN